MAFNRISVVVSTVGTSWKIQQVTTPPSYRVMRVRVYPTSPATKVAFRIQESVATISKPSVVPVHSVLEYDLTDDFIDSVESTDVILVKSYATREGLPRSSYLAVKTDIATDTVYIEMDIEVLR